MQTIPQLFFKNICSKSKSFFSSSERELNQLYFDQKKIFALRPFHETRWNVKLQNHKERLQAKKYIPNEILFLPTLLAKCQKAFDPTLFNHITNKLNLIVTHNQ